jgi:glutaminyl-peptide cyclotransferase
LIGGGRSATGALAGLALLTLLPAPAPSRAADLPVQPAPRATAAEPERLTVRVISVRPHDPGAYTQGLLLHDGWLYESTGRDRGEARLRQVDPVTGVAVREVFLPPAPDGSTYWGEGLALVGRRLIQLTWLHGVAFVHDLHSFDQIGRYRYEGEGWGLCYDGRRLVMSDGSSALQFRDPDTFALLGRVDVTESGRPVVRLNELECVGGSVYANVFLTDEIVRIDAQSGAVTARIDAGGLLAPDERAAADVLNGIAYDPDGGTFLITGKWWPKLFEVTFRPADDPDGARAYLPLAARG